MAAITVCLNQPVYIKLKEVGVQKRRPAAGPLLWIFRYGPCMSGEVWLLGPTDRSTNGCGITGYCCKQEQRLE